MGSTDHKERSLSVAILAYNEEATVEAAVRHVHGALQHHGGDFEILVVDDGSTDRTGRIVETVARHLSRVELLTHETNRGPGSGIRTGMGACTKEAFTFFAADFQGNFSQRLAYLPRLGREADVLVGQRVGSPQKSLWRHATSKVFVTAMRGLFGIPFDDFNFFYFFSKDVLSAVTPRSETAFICPEIMVRALDLGFRVEPVVGDVYSRHAGKATVGKLGHVLRVSQEMASLWAERHKPRLFPCSGDDRRTEPKEARSSGPGPSGRYDRASAPRVGGF